MLFAGGERELGSGRLRWRMAFGGKFWWIVVDRSGLVLDTRFVPGAHVDERDNACIYLLLNGAFEALSPIAKKIEGPSALLLSEEQLEGATKLRSLTYRAMGEPFVSVQIHFPNSFLAIEPPQRSHAPPHVLELDEKAWSVAREVADAARVSADDSFEPMQRLVSMLVAQGIVLPEAMKPVVVKTPAPLELLWRGVRPMVERLYLTPTVEEVSSATGISVRQVDRYIGQFLARFGHLGGTGWRLATRHMRLKLAVLWLSADGISIADVATATSYGSADAMARAFRDAGLPSPSKIQSTLRK